MTRQYPIVQAGAQVGTATIDQHGMFWMIRCRCSVRPQQAQRIILKAGMKTHDLGLCIGQPEGCGLNTRVPIRQFATDELVFIMEVASRDTFLQITADQPFPAIEKLRDSRFIVHEGKVGIVPND